MVRRLHFLPLLLVMFLFSSLWSTTGAATGTAVVQPPSISAQSAALIDVESGRILYGKNPTKKMRIASLTKIMTAIVAIEESSNLNRSVKVPDYAVGTEGSSIYLKKGETLSLNDLLYGLMLRSGNDAAVTIADNVGGSVEGFVRLMNEKAAYIGMEYTNFSNPHGLDDSNQNYSTARDMAILAAYALQNPTFQKIVATKVKTISWEGEKWGRKLKNKNKMLSLYKGADGIKTGYTKLSGRSLASSATRDGRQLAVIVLNDPRDWDDSSALLDYGFSQFTRTKLVEKNNQVTSGVYALNDFTYPLRDGEEQKIEKRLMLFASETDGKNNVSRNKETWSLVGHLQLYLDNQLIGKVALTNQPVKDVNSSSPSGSGIFNYFLQFWKYLFSLSYMR